MLDGCYSIDLSHWAQIVYRLALVLREVVEARHKSEQRKLLLRGVRRLRDAAMADAGSLSRS